MPDRRAASVAPCRDSDHDAHDPALSVVSVGACEEGRRQGAEPGRGGDRTSPAVELEQQASVLGSVVEWPVSGEVALDGLEEVPGALARERLLGLLRLVPIPSEHPIEQARRELLAVDSL